MMVHKKEPDGFKKELDKLFAATTKSSMIHKCNMHVENGSGTFMWNREYGERTIHSIMNLASVRKLFTTTCIINLIQQGKLSLTDHLDKDFESELLEDIHIYKGKDYSYEITVGNLLFQNTGFPDVFAMNKIYLNKRMRKVDFRINLEDYVQIAKENNKRFAPTTAGKAHYSDLKFEMLGKINEQTEQSSLHDAYKKYIFAHLN